MSTTLVDETRT